MITNIIKKILLYLLICLHVSANELSFNEAWIEVLKHSDALRAKNEDLNIALFKKDVAKDLYLPSVTLSALYTHLDKPLEAKMDDLGASLDKNALHAVVGGIAKGASNAAYTEALNAGKSSAEAMSIAQKTANDLLLSFSKITSDLQNASIELSKQDIFTSSVRAVWAVFTGGKRSGANIIANGQIKEAKALYEMAKQGQFEDLANIYFGVVLSREIAKTKQEVQESFQKHYNHAQKLYSQGQIAKIETLSAKVRLDKAIVDTKKAKRNYEIAQIALKSLLHSTKLVITKTNLFTNQNLPNLNTFLSKTLSSYPGLELIESKKDQTKGLVKVEKGEFYPQVFVFGNYNLYKDDSILSENIPDWMVGVGVNYNLLDSHGRRGKLDMAYSNSLKASFMYEDAKRKLSVLVEKTYKIAKLALEEYEGLNSSIELGEESVRLREKSFMQGMATSLDVIDAQLFLQGVKTQRLVASYKYVLALSRLLALSNQIENFSQYESME